ncbi:MAG: hypothetical protein N2109_03630 [Fimbriimonadales bacterium]|nr:hypothetical protein [Fimbriimonadales bacterium]
MENLPSTPIDVLLWPVVLVLLSAAIWYFALGQEAKMAAGGAVFRLGEQKVQRSEKPRQVRWKWLALLPLVVSAVWKSPWAYGLVTDTAFQLTYPGRKVTYALWAAVFLPLLGAVILAGYGAFMASKRRRW